MAQSVGRQVELVQDAGAGGQLEKNALRLPVERGKNLGSHPAVVAGKDGETSNRPGLRPIPTRLQVGLDGISGPVG